MIPRPPLTHSFDSLSWDHDPNLDGDGIFVMALDRPDRQSPMSVAETLWHALLSFCADSCHNIHYDMRGGHRIRIESGSHDTKQWQFRGSSWEQATKKAVLTMMPGYWTHIDPTK